MEIPIFPLPMVLFPQVIVPLHIFEERYKQMVGRCLRDSENFGIACVPSGLNEEEGTIRAIGVSARIVQSERLDDGRRNIMAAGEKRFRILRFTGSKPYWTAEVEYFEDDAADDGELQESYQQSLRLYRQVTALAAQLRGADNEETALTHTPETLSFMVSFVLDIALESKQELLEMTSTAGRLRSLAIYLEQAIQRLTAEIARDSFRHKVKGNGHLGSDRK